MDLTSLIPDNLSELLVKIVQFTASRRPLLHRNIHKMHTPGFEPQDLPVCEFVHVLNEAIVEHLSSRRLLFRDTENITFGGSGTMHVTPVADKHAEALLTANPDDYLEHQVDKLLENSLNERVAQNLLRLKRDILSEAGHLHASRTRTDADALDNPSAPYENDQ